MNIFNKLKTMVVENNNKMVFYIAANEDNSVGVFETFRNALENKYAYWISANAVNSLVLENGSEITILPQEDADELLALPKSDFIVVEATTNTKNILDKLSKKTEGFVVVDASTKDLL